MEKDYTTTRGKPKPKPTASHGGHDPVSKSDLMSSAKVLAGAAKSALAHESDKVDKAQVAGAAADLLSAAKQYGKLEEKSFGKYFDKAEGCLHNYHSSHSASPTAAASPSAGAHHGGYASHGGEGKHGHSSSGGGYGEYVKLAQGFLKKPDHDGGDGGHSSGGDYIKLAQGFLKKDDHGDGGHGHSSGGAGDYIKLAQGFLKKH
uniref:Uncharacterized protein n=2 Tax=Opuntia streptacantha TaxID=393608 RepID=A0A7C9D552_OPUST